MRSATLSTLLLAGVALICLAAAGYYYPWPQPQVQTEVEQLFESYNGSQVRGLEIATFNRNRGALEKIKLVRRGDRWIIPSKQNYPASQGARIAMAINSLADLKVLDIMSDNQQDHLDFGVVDPEDYQDVANRSSLGTKITLTDRNQKEIGSLILGLPVKDEANVKHFARITNQPNVYVIDYDPRVLSTDFSSWVSTNPLQLAQSQGDNGQTVNAVDINYYRLMGDDPANPTKDVIYQAELRPTENGRMGVPLLQTSDPGSKEMRKLVATPQQVAEITQMGQFLSRIVSNDVKRKDSDASEAIKSNQAFDPKMTESMKQYGFTNCRIENGNFECDSASGNVRLYTPTGLIMTLSFGAIAGTTQDGSGNLNYVMTITAGVNDDVHQIPEKPADLNEDPTSDENKAYQRSVQEAKEKREAARNAANELNRIHADWYYVIGDDVLKRLRPEITIPQPVAPPTNVSPLDPKPGSEDGKPGAAPATNQGGSTSDPNESSSASGAESGTEKSENAGDGNDLN
ncbi:MAG: DUF4340 domain-containing protein [Planctomycetota bacterium]|nr:DUF4340 domain-containing protein [Planctomycetota bacterium]